MTKPGSSERFPSIIITSKTAELLSTYATSAAAVASAGQYETEGAYARYMLAKHELVAWLQELEDSSPLVTDQPHNYTRIRF